MRKSIVTVLGPTDPVHDLTTVEAVNAALGLTSNTDDDGIIAEQITKASRLIADICFAGPERLRTFGLLTLQESFRVKWAEPIEVLYLRHYPVQQIISVSEGTAETDATIYEVDDENGLIWLKCGRWCGEVITQYSGGYDLPTEAPPALAQACIETIRSQRTTAARDPAVRQVQHGDTSITYSDYYNRFAAGGTSSAVLPPNATEMIQPYIRKVV